MEPKEVYSSFSRIRYDVWGGRGAVYIICSSESPSPLSPLPSLYLPLSLSRERQIDHITSITYPSDSAEADWLTLPEVAGGDGANRSSPMVM